MRGSGWTRRRLRAPLLSLSIVIIASGAMAGLAIALSSGGDTTAPLPVIYAHNPGGTAPVGAVDPSLAKDLVVFERAQQPNDVPPADVVTNDAKRRGANVGLARLAGSFGGQTVYIVPATGGACLVSTSLLANGCFSTADILAGNVEATIACWPYMPADQEETFGIMPHASNMMATYSDGSRRPVQVNGDVYVLDARPATAPYPTELAWDEPAGHHAAPSGIAPLSRLMPHPCTATSLSPDHSSPSRDLAQARRRIAKGLQ